MDYFDRPDVQQAFTAMRAAVVADSALMTAQCAALMNGWTHPSLVPVSPLPEDRGVRAVRCTRDTAGYLTMQVEARSCVGV